jgi:predicted ATP-binding protein involved in virulence
MRLRHLALVNFRGFEKLDLPLEEDLTVLVGINGSGKTTILEAIARAVLLTIGPGAPGFTERDIRDDSHETWIIVDADEGGERTRFQHRLPGPPLSLERSAVWVDSPFLFYYSVARNAADATPGSTNPGQWDPTQALVGAAEPVTTFEAFFHWFREREDLENEDRRSKPDHRDQQLEAVRRAVELAVPGYGNLRVRRPRFETGRSRVEKPELVLDKGGATLAFSQFSTGERTLVALVADIARRMAIARPGRPALEQEAFVLIDEVELHLHPKWQAELPGRLRKTFPNVQFILATHSPLVLSQVERRCVRILDNFTLVKPGAPTRGRDANALLSEVFNVPPRPNDVQEEIAAIADLIDRDSLGDAKGRLEKLGERLGETDTDVTRLRTMIELLSA